MMSYWVLFIGIAVTGWFSTDEFAEQIQGSIQNSDRKRYDRTRRGFKDAARQWNL